jgi:hypothetical protein
MEELEIMIGRKYVEDLKEYDEKTLASMTEADREDYIRQKNANEHFD